MSSPFAFEPRRVEIRREADVIQNGRGARAQHLDRTEQRGDLNLARRTAFATDGG